MCAMDAKLTLKLDKEVIDRAKEYASSQNRSLSRLIESYLKSLINKEYQQSVSDAEISPYVKSLKTGVNVLADIDQKKVRGDYLSEKHK